MIISSIRIKALKTENKMVGVASITLDSMIAIHGIKILNGPTGLFLAMPSKTIKPGMFEDMVHPINTEVRNAIETIIYNAYEYCISNNLYAAQFDIPSTLERHTLLDQTFNEFVLSIQKENNIAEQSKYMNTKKTLKNEKDDLKSNAQDNAFWDWMNN